MHLMFPESARTEQNISLATGIKFIILRFLIYEINILKTIFLLFRKLDIKIRGLNQCQMNDRSNDKTIIS